MADVWERLRAKRKIIVAAILAGIIILTPVLAFLTFTGLLREPVLEIVYVSKPGPLYSDNTYSDIEVAVNNAGEAMAEGCFARAYDHHLFSTWIAEGSVLGSSERFELAPGEGLVTSVSIYLPDVSGEALLGGGIRSFLIFRLDCENAVSSEETVGIRVSSPET